MEEDAAEEEVVGTGKVLDEQKQVTMEMGRLVPSGSPQGSVENWRQQGQQGHHECRDKVEEDQRREEWVKEEKEAETEEPPGSLFSYDSKGNPRSFLTNQKSRPLLVLEVKPWPMKAPKSKKLRREGPLPLYCDANKVIFGRQEVQLVSHLPTKMGSTSRGLQCL